MARSVCRRLLHVLAIVLAFGAPPAAAQNGPPLGSPQTVYVPCYNSTAAYGDWAYPESQPYSWPQPYGYGYAPGDRLTDSERSESSQILSQGFLTVERVALELIARKHLTADEIQLSLLHRAADLRCGISCLSNHLPFAQCRSRPRA